MELNSLRRITWRIKDQADFDVKSCHNKVTARHTLLDSAVRKEKEGRKQRM